MKLKRNTIIVLGCICCAVTIISISQLYWYCVISYKEKRLKSENWIEAMEAARWLALNLGAKAIPTLAAGLDTQYMSVRRVIIESLLSIGDDGRRVAEEHLLRCLTSADNVEREDSVIDLLDIGSGDKVPTTSLIELLVSPRPDFPALGRRGLISKGQSVVPELINALVARTGEVRQHIIAVLKSLGSEARTILIRRLAGEEDAERRKILQEGLKAFES